MKVLRRAGARRLCLLVPFALLAIFVIAVSGPISLSGATTYGPPGSAIPPPVPGFTPAPVPPAFHSVMSVQDVSTLLANGANTGNTTTPNVHIIDVRSQFEYQADVCPMQIALGLPTYNVTNTGHPVWTWASTRSHPAVYEEAYADPYWIGFYWAGVPYAAYWNLRMEENPNFGQYLLSLVHDGSIKFNDKLIFLCQTGYRASWAAAEATSLGFTDSNVIYGGMLAWEDDWYPQYSDPVTGVEPIRPAVNCLNDPNDPSPGDSPCTPGQNGDPDNIAGPNARAKTTVLSAPWTYNLARLTAAGYTPYWNGTEPHVGVKPEWMNGMGVGDFNLSLTAGNARFATYLDYTNGDLSVDFTIHNNPPAPPSGMNYPAACGGAPAPAGSCEQVYQNQHGTAYNTQIVRMSSSVVATNLPASIGSIPANGAGTATVTFHNPPAAGTVFYVSPVYATATDVPDPNVTYGAGNGWYGTYTYPTPAG